MRNEMLASTSSGVETVSVLDKQALDKLATWLCNEESYHDDKRPRSSRMDQMEWDRCEERFESERKNNGGYCDPCMDFAGKLLSEFDLRVKV